MHHRVHNFTLPPSLYFFISDTPNRGTITTIEQPFVLHTHSLLKLRLQTSILCLFFEPLALGCSQPTNAYPQIKNAVSEKCRTLGIFFSAFVFRCPMDVHMRLFSYFKPISKRYYAIKHSVCVWDSKCGLKVTRGSDA